MNFGQIIKVRLDECADCAVWWLELRYFLNVFILTKKYLQATYNIRTWNSSTTFKCKKSNGSKGSSEGSNKENGSR